MDGLKDDKIQGLSKDNKVHIANQTGMFVRVIVVPNKDYIIGDMVATIATSIASAIATDGASLGEIPAEIKSFSDLMKLINLVKTMGSMGGMMYKEGELCELFNKTTIKIPPFKVENVLKKELYNPLDYLGPSGWAAIFGGKDVTLAIILWNDASNKVLEITHFNTNSDHSWLVDGSGVHRVKYGHLWEVQEGGPTHNWDN
jgi:hypothetical protein